MSSAPVAVARVTAVCPLSQCTFVPLGSFKLPPTQQWRGPRATSEPVDGRVQAWTRLALGPRSQKRLREDRTRSTHKDGEVSVRLPSFVAPLFGRYSRVQVTAAYSRHTQAYVGRARVVRRLTGSVRSKRCRLARFLQGRFLCGFCRGFFCSCQGAGEGVLFPGQRRGQSLQEGLSLSKAQPNTTRAPTRKLEGPMAQPTKEPQEEASFAMDHEVKRERTHKTAQGTHKVVAAWHAPFGASRSLVWSLGVRFPWSLLLWVCDGGGCHGSLRSLSAKNMIPRRGGNKRHVAGSSCDRDRVSKSPVDLAGVGFWLFVQSPVDLATQKRSDK